MDTRLSTLHAQRNLLEEQLLWLERAMDAREGVPLVGRASEARAEAADLAADVGGLLVRLATVNAELAAMRSVPGQA